jgi:hypothetical protein
MWLSAAGMPRKNGSERAAVAANSSYISDITENEESG